MNRPDDIRVVLLHGGASKHFTAGLDLSLLPSLFRGEGQGYPLSDISRQTFRIRQSLSWLQSTFTRIETCRVPVIAAIHGACIGGGIDLACACDIRLCSEDAWFSIKEVDIGIAADLGTLQRLPLISGNDSWVRQMAYTGIRWSSAQALTHGFVSQVISGDKHALLEQAWILAKDIASKSPVAIHGIKRSFRQSTCRQGVSLGLDFVADWNATHFLSKDVMSSPSKIPFAKL